MPPFRDAVCFVHYQKVNLYVLQQFGDPVGTQGFGCHVDQFRVAFTHLFGVFEILTGCQ